LFSVPLWNLWKGSSDICITFSCHTSVLLKAAASRATRGQFLNFLRAYVHIGTFCAYTKSLRLVNVCFGLVGVYACVCKVSASFKKTALRISKWLPKSHTKL
jgi:hypothetical protein